MMPKKVKLPYGTKPLKIEVPDNAEVVLPHEMKGIRNVKRELRRAIENPIGAELNVKKDDTVALAVSDKTRGIPRDEMIYAVLDAIDVPDEQVSIIIANGNHPMEPLDTLVGKDILQRFKVVNHDSIKGEMSPVGTTSKKTKVSINKLVADANVKILIGQIKPHFFAGYSGGAKSIIPGVASVTTIGINHMMMSQPRAKLGIINGNPVREDMEEAARLSKVSFILNVVLNRDGELVKAFAGDVVAAQRAGVEVARKISDVRTKHADIVIVSDGFPLNINIYQTTKLVAPAEKVVNPGGVIIVVSECNEGTGPINTVQLIGNLLLKKELREGADIYLVCNLKAEDVKKTFFAPVESLETALDMAYRKVGKDATVSVMPKGGVMVPILGDEKEKDWE
jgi:nickel-dependent lactate racemase